MKRIIRIPFFSLSIFPLIFAFSLIIMVACGSGGGMGDGKKNNNLQGDTPGTGSLSKTGFEDADQPYNPVATRNNKQALPGEVVKVDSTEARGSSRWSEEGDAAKTANPSKLSSGASVSGTASTRLDKTAGKRARYALIGSNARNRSRVGQSLRADNTERPNEEIYLPK